MRFFIHAASLLVVPILASCSPGAEAPVEEAQDVALSDFGKSCRQTFETQWDMAAKAEAKGAGSRLAFAAMKTRFAPICACAEKKLESQLPDYRMKLAGEVMAITYKPEGAKYSGAEARRAANAKAQDEAKAFMSSRGLSYETFADLSAKTQLAIAQCFSQRK
ncbi:MAG: hypothetical protein R3C60_09975 [Parvularculaceae bacterium]